MAALFHCKLTVGTRKLTVGTRKKLPKMARSAISGSYSAAQNLLNHRRDRVTHLAGAHFARVRFTGAEDVARAMTGFNGVTHGTFNRRRRVVQTKAVAEHQGAGEDLRDGVRQIFARDVRGSAARGFIDAEDFVAIRRAQAGAGQHTERTTERRRFIAQNIAEHIFAEQHVELRGLEHELHRAIVHEHVIERHVGIFFGDAGDGFAPEDAVFQHVRFIDARQFLAAQLRGFERDVRDAFDLGRGVNHRINRALLAVGERLGLLGLTEIHAAGQFAHHEDINAVALAFFRERAGVGKHLGQFHRAQIREQAEFLAQAQQCGAFGTFFLGNRRVAIRQTDGAEEDGIRFLADLQRDVGERLLGEINAGPADGRIRDVEFEAEPFFGGAENFDGFAHDFRPDAVAREGSDVECFHELERIVYFFSAT